MGASFSPDKAARGFAKVPLVVDVTAGPPCVVSVVRDRFRGWEWAGSSGYISPRPEL